MQFEFDTKKEEALTVSKSQELFSMHNTRFPSVITVKSVLHRCIVVNDDVGLCYDCDEEQHQHSGKLTTKHKRIPISEVGGS